MTTLDEATEAFNNDDFVRSFKLFHELRATNDKEVLFYLGLHYKEGYGTSVDMDNALYYWKKANNKGSLDAKYRLLEITQTTSQCCKN